MTADEMRVELETEMAWRQEEMGFFKNQLNNIADNEKDRYRKSLIILLYSHMEGYIKICLQIYIKYINSQHLLRKDVISELIVSGMSKEFHAYENLDRKCEFFKSFLPNDTQLHRYYRHIDFINQIDDFLELLLTIEDGVIDTESNLWHAVLKKNLYKVGLPIDAFDEYSNDINALVNRRNSIAHGSAKSGVVQQEYEKWENKVNEIMSDITRIVYDFAYNKRYLKSV